MNLSNEIEHLKKQKEYFDEVIYAISADTIGYSELTSVIGPILTVNSTSLESVILLAKKGYYRDLIILSRPFLEAIINIGYIIAEGEAAIISSKKYAYQKGYRDLFRNLEVNDFIIKSGFSDFKEEFEKAAPKEMLEALEEYTTKSGKEKSLWSPETTKAKIEIIGKKYGPYINSLLSFAFFSIYRDVSEIIHNSYYGVRIFMGMQQKDVTSFKSIEETTKYFSRHQEKFAALIVQQMNISITALLNIISQKFKLKSTNDIFEKSNRTLVEYAAAQK